MNSNAVEQNRVYSNFEVEYMVSVYGDMVYRIAYIKTRNKEKAEDIFQEVFIKFMKLNKRLDNQEHEKAWMINATSNCCKDLWKSAWNRRVVYDYKQSGIYEENLVDSFDGVRNIVMELSDKYRTIIHLYYYEELGIKEISELLSLNQNTVCTRLSRARELLKRKLEKGGFDYEI